MKLYEQSIQNAVLSDFSNYIRFKQVESKTLHSLKPGIPCILLHNTMHDRETDINLTVPGGQLHTSVPNDTSLTAPGQHTHDTYSFIIVLGGNITYTIASQMNRATSGHILLLNRNVEFSEEYSSEADIAFLHCSSELIRRLLAVLKTMPEYYYRSISILEDLTGIHEDNHMHSGSIYYSFTPVKKQTGAAVEEACRNIAKVLQAYGESSSYLDLIAGICRLLQLIRNSRSYAFTRSESKLTQREYLFRQMCNIIRKYDGDIKRHDLENTLNYNGEYLNSIMKEYSNLTITDFAADWRMRCFVKRLTETDDSIFDILENLGITNQNYFYTSFKNKYSMTPLKYRQAGSKEFTAKGHRPSFKLEPTHNLSKW